MAPRKILIAGAGGRDFHNFNVLYRDDPGVRVVCFTATQIPNIGDRRYPPELAGPLYPEGIPIFDEADLTDLIGRYGADEVLFSYSDVSHQHVMAVASRAIAAGAAFRLAGTAETMLKAAVPVVSICAVRTGSGKSQTTRHVSRLLAAAGRRAVVVRHPMPYGDLARQRVQRFAELADLDRHACTIEEREEYEPHVEAGNLVYAGCDYEAILRQAETEADVVLWDGGNNDFSFYLPALEIVVADPHRVGDELTYYPGRINLTRAHVVVINKADSARPRDVEKLRENVRSVNPTAAIVEADSPLTVSDPDAIRGKRVLVVEDGPTLTHGGMAYGAGVLAARAHGAAELVDPRPYAVGEIAEVFARYPHVAGLLPAVGYGEKQVRDLAATINATPCDLVVIGTPIDLRRVLRLTKPAVRVTYELRERTSPGLAEFLRARGLL